MKFKPFIGPIVLILIVFFPIFGHLGVIPIQLWDESRLAIHAVEMIKNHNWIVTTVNGLPDMIGTKPPFMIWMQVISIKLFGYNEVAVRLPSAFAALGTCLLIYYVFARKSKDPLPGIIAAAVLVTAPGYVTLHGTRTGEYDALLTLFTTGYVVFFYLYCEENKPKYLFAVFVLITLATLTKGIQALVFSPALVVYAVYKEKIISILKEKQFYIGLAVFLFFGLGYYLLREHYNPGFIKAMQENEIGGRYNSVIEGHQGRISYYYTVLVKYHFNYWYIYVIPGIVAGVFSKEKWMRDFILLSFYFGFLYLAVISNAQTKVFWYLIPLYPFLAILVGIFINTICKLLLTIESVKTIMTYNLLPCLFLFFMFAIPYANIISIVSADYNGTDRDPNRKNMSFFLKDILHKNDHTFDGTAFLNDDFNSDLDWYFKVFELEHRPIKEIARSEITPSEKIVVFLPDSKKFLEGNYNTQVVSNWNNVTLYQLSGKK